MRFIFFVLLCFSLNSKLHAYKIKTHIWIGSEVLEDVFEDGKVSIPPFGDFKVEQQLIDALEENPRAYLYGNIGPDFFPDMIAGQMVVHPGGLEKGQWNTDDWFAYLLSSKNEMKASELSFSMGYLAHGAADFWAHTYANTYAGSVFEINDGDSLEGEKRHFLIEGFIDYHTPDALTRSGKVIGKGSELFKHYQGELPYDFMIDKLIYDPSLRNQYGATAPHLTAINKLHSELPKWIDFVDGRRNPIYKKIGDIIERNIPEAKRVLADKRDLTHEMCANSNATADTITPSTEELAEGISREERIIYEGIINAADGVLKDTSENLRERSQELFDLVDTYVERGFNAVVSASSRVDEAEINLIGAKHKVSQKILELEKSVNEKNCKFLSEALKAPAGLHSYLVSELPFGEEINKALIFGLDPTGSLGIKNPLDPLGLFGGKSPPPPPKVKIETGDRDYFLRKISRNKARLIELQLEEEELDELSSDYFEEWMQEAYTNIANERAEIKIKNQRYSNGIEGLIEGQSISIVSSAGESNGLFNNSSNNPAAWLCSSVNGFSNKLLSESVNKVTELELKLVDSRKLLVAELDRLEEDLRAAAQTFHTLAYQVHKTAHNTSVDLLKLGGRLHDEVLSAQAALKLENEITSKVNQLVDDMCSDIKKFEEFIDYGAVEGAPFVAAYFIDFFLKQVDKDSKTDLYTEWLYYGLKVWQVGLDEAMLGYQETQKEIVDILLTEGKGVGDVQSAILDWFICESPKLFGLNSYTAQHLCIVKSSIEGVSETVNSIIKEIDRGVHKYGLPGIPEDLKLTKKNIDKHIGEITEYWKREAISESELVELLFYVIEGAGDDHSAIDHEFSYSIANNLTFDERTDPFTKRMRAEMYVEGERGFNPKKFVPIYNSIVLAKLTLLNASELNRMVRMAGGHSKEYGDSLFSQSPGIPFNILIGAVKTLDGDHQWLPETPRHMKTHGAAERSASNDSYSRHEDPKKGFRLYQDPLARQNVFLKIFKGPAIAAIQSPGVFNFPNNIPSEYPYRPCADYPYPDGEKDHTCTMSWLMPIITDLLDSE